MSTCAEDRLVRIARLSEQEALTALGSAPAGLSDDEVRQRFKQDGPNAVSREAQRGPLRRLLNLFAAPLPLLLLVLALVSWLTGEVHGATMIAIIVVASTLLAFVQEHRSGVAADRLRSMVRTQVAVIRAASNAATPQPRAAALPSIEQMPRTADIALEQLVAGDLIHLSAGDIIAADLRVLSARDLFVNQSTFTGEAMPVEKHAAAQTQAVLSPYDLSNCCFMGTHVVSGTAIALVVATGPRTHFGAIAARVLAPSGRTRFDAGVQRYVGLMLRVMLVMVPLIFVINGWAKGQWMEALLFATALAVGLTPEMLPMIVTINLAKGALAMSAKRVIVKRLAAIQDLGAMDVLCTDKTGTLTQDKVLLKRHVDVAGHDSASVLELAYLNSYHQSGLKNLLDLAVLEHADVHERLDVSKRYRKIDEVPFDFQRRRMSVIVERRAGDAGSGAEGAHLLICKGAVEEVFAVCSQCEYDGKVQAIEPSHGPQLLDVVRTLNEDGFRVIAVAYKELPAAQSIYAVADESALILAGYIAFLDPPKDSAAPALAALKARGIRVKILTGDNEVVARKICRDVGLDAQQVLLGSQISTLTPPRLTAAVERTTLFAKLAPEQKAQVINILKAQGHVVGYMGDGINDGPALKAADVGLSVDTAVDIAKDSAQIVLLEKSLLVLNDGVIEGRKVLANILKYLKMSASSNFGNMLSVVGASLFLPFLPMAPVQILVNNLLYDISQTTVATDRVDAADMQGPRRWDMREIARYMLAIGPISSVFDYATFGLLWWVFAAQHNPALFHSGWFVESLLSQTLIVHVIRTRGRPFVDSRASLPLTLTTSGVALLGLLLPYSPLAGALGLVPLPLAYLAALGLLLIAYAALTQLVKRRWVEPWLSPVDRPHPGP